jgi:hypothetical protein
MEENNNNKLASEPDLTSSVTEPVQTQEAEVDPAVVPPVNSPKSVKKWLIIAVASVAAVLLVAGLWFLLKKDEVVTDASQKEVVVVSNFAECAAAGYPVMESMPEKCSIPSGKTFVNSVAEETPAKSEEVASTPKCANDETLFSSKNFGAAFCYPSEWGKASVMEAKVDTADTGYREAVRFSVSTKFIVGGVSEDWTTTVGRDVGCQEPSNTVPELSSYDTEWHDVVGAGMATEFATRSVASLGGGYDITETVSNLLDSGVCVQGHKVINGSRYKVISEAYYTEFSETSGITTPKAHMDNSSVLFTVQERAQFDALLLSAASY